MGKLRERMVHDMNVRNLAPRTIEAYVVGVKGLAKYYMKPPDQLTDVEVHRYLLHLRDERKLSASTRNQVRSALKFFYEVTVRRPRASLTVPPERRAQKLPEILSRAEVERMLEVTSNVRHRVLLMAAYGSGLRVSEVVALRPADIDLERGVVRVVQGKGRKDRYTVLSDRLTMEIERYYEQCGRPETWVFWRQSDPCQHTDISTAQKTYYRAKRRAGITKQGGIHALRHAFATHSLEAGVELPTIGRMLGHNSVTTTMRYLYTTTQRVSGHISPLDRLLIGKPIENAPSRARLK